MTPPPIKSIEEYMEEFENEFMYNGMKYGLLDRTKVKGFLEKSLQSQALSISEALEVEEMKDPENVDLISEPSRVLDKVISTTYNKVIKKNQALRQQIREKYQLDNLSD